MPLHGSTEKPIFMVATVSASVSAKPPLIRSATAKRSKIFHDYLLIFCGISPVFLNDLLSPQNLKVNRTDHKIIRNSIDFPSSDLAVILPPCASTIDLTTDNPMP